MNNLSSLVPANYEMDEQKNNPIEIPTQLVDRHFEMDPETTRLLLDGTRLRNEMIVLLESDDFRADMEDARSSSTRATSLKYNRWCRVSELTPVPNTQYPEIAFIGIYAEGTQKKFRFSTNFAWYVLIDSIPKEIPTLPTDIEVKSNIDLNRCRIVEYTVAGDNREEIKEEALRVAWEVYKDIAVHLVAGTNYEMEKVSELTPSYSVRRSGKRYWADVRVVVF